MAWAGSTRKATLPGSWESIRRIVMDRDGWSCQAVEDGVRCGRHANQCDHIGDPLDHSEGNLQALCKWHHDRKSAQQGNAARWARPQAKRPAKKHPGLL